MGGTRPIFVVALLIASLNCCVGFHVGVFAPYRGRIQPGRSPPSEPRPMAAQQLSRVTCRASITEQDSLESPLDALRQERDHESTLFLLTPGLMFFVAFLFYPQTSRAFHEFVELASGHTWESVDGGATLTDLISPALTGPVANFISLLFGTLTSMTVGQLYSRQNQLAQLLGDLLGDIRLLEIHAKTLPTKEYQTEAQQLVQSYLKIAIENLDVELSYEKRKEGREAGRRILERKMELFHRVSGDKAVAGNINGRALDEAYSTLNRLIQTRSQLVTTYENAFPLWHYGNLAILAFAILFIFLVLTDKTSLAFLGGFQLRVCWAMLIGTLAMLTVVVIDLISPLSGAFQIIQPLEMRGIMLDDYLVPQMEEDESDISL